MSAPDTVAVLLAGGAGSRFDGPTHKLLAPLRGRRLIEWSLDAPRAAGLSVWVVWGAAGPDALDLPGDVLSLSNPRWRHGMATSMQVAITRARAERVEALVFGTADQPFLTPSAWSTVAATPGSIVVATYGGRHGHPVKLARDTWDLVPATGEAGGRAVMQVRPEAVVEVACDGDPADIDTFEELERWNS